VSETSPGLKLKLRACCKTERSVEAWWVCGYGLGVTTCSPLRGARSSSRSDLPDPLLGRTLVLVLCQGEPCRQLCGHAGVADDGDLAGLVPTRPSARGDAPSRIRARWPNVALRRHAELGRAAGLAAGARAARHVTGGGARLGRPPAVPPVRPPLPPADPRAARPPVATAACAIRQAVRDASWRMDIRPADLPGWALRIGAAARRRDARPVGTGSRVRRADAARVGANLAIGAGVAAPGGPALLALSAVVGTDARLRVAGTAPALAENWVAPRWLCRCNPAAGQRDEAGRDGSEEATPRPWPREQPRDPIECLAVHDG
jgi:hypothetical protein